MTDFRTGAIERDTDGRLVLVAEDGRRLEPVDEVIALTGFRPDLTFLSAIRLGLDERLQAPTALAPLSDPNVHSCGTVYPHGVNELSHPEQGVYLVGMKSYGRAPTFLTMTGYEQTRSIAAAIAGDREAAERVELTLPATGVCGGAGLFDQPDTTQDAGGGCCAAPAVLQIGIGAPATTSGGRHPRSSSSCSKTSPARTPAWTTLATTSPPPPADWTWRAWPPPRRTTPPAATPYRTRWGHGPGKEPWEVYVVKADAGDLTKQPASTCCSADTTPPEPAATAAGRCC